MNHYESEDQERTECPTCGESYASEHGVKIHHKKIHGESIASYTNECNWCGLEFTISEAREHKEYCSDECRTEFQSDRISGENHHHWTDPDPVACEQCGELFDPQTGNPNRFCSRTCNAEWQSEAFGNDDWHLTGLTGPDHPAYKGHVDYYGPNWPEQSSKARERDGYQCVACPMTQGEHLPLYGCKLHVHHIVRKEAFRNDDGTLDYTEANDLSNLITLCRVCHPKWESIPLRPQ